MNDEAMEGLLLAFGKNNFEDPKGVLYWLPVKIVRVKRTLEGFSVTYGCETEGDSEHHFGRETLPLDVSFEDLFGFMWQYFNKKVLL